MINLIEEKIILNEQDIKEILAEKFGPNVKTVEITHSEDRYYGGPVRYSVVVVRDKETNEH